jgi:hypothetical protein
MPYCPADISPEGKIFVLLLILEVALKGEAFFRFWFRFR